MSLTLVIMRRDQSHIWEITVDLNQSVQNLKEEIQKKGIEKLMDKYLFFKLELKCLKTVLDDNNKPIHELKLKENQKLIVKDLGPQILWSTVFYIEYLGPILILSLLYYFGNRSEYSNVQTIAFLMGSGHFLKRELETMFVHVFSRDSMPQHRFLINVFHYWILFGLIVGLEIFIFRDLTKLEFTPIRMIILFSFIVTIIQQKPSILKFFEFMNLMCHITLANLRKKSDKKTDQYVALQKQRGIPKGFGFDYVSSANYFWEVMSWLSFSLFTGSYAAFAFTIFSFVQMLVWAQEKHRRYKKEFGDKYPRGRKAMVPFIV